MKVLSVFKKGYKAKAICLECGTARARISDAYCINGHDDWIEEQDRAEYPNLWNLAKLKFKVSNKGLEASIKNSRSLT